MRRWIGVVCFVILLSFASAARSDNSILDVNLTAAGGTARVVTGFHIYLSYGAVSNVSTIFDTFTFTAGDVGTVFSVNQSVDNSFNIWANNLTNGINQVMSSMLATDFGEIGGNVGQESDFLVPHPPGSNGIDLQGYAISSISLTFSQLTINSPGSNPNGDGIWTDIACTGTLSFIGHAVPEPSTAALLLGGFLGLAVFRRRGVRRN